MVSAGYNSERGLPTAAFFGQDKKALRVICQAQFLRAAKHSLALHPSQLADLDLQAARKNRAREGQRHLVACYVILCPAHDSSRFWLDPSSTRQTLRRSALGCGLDSRICATTTFGKSAPLSRDAFHLYSSTGQQIV